MRLKNKWGWGVIAVSLILLFVSAACANQVLSLYLVFHKEGSVDLKQMKVVEGHKSVSLPPGEYRFVLTDINDRVVYSESRAVKFLVMSDPPQETDKESLLIRIPYTPNMNALNIYKGSELLLSKTLNICNLNGVCDMDRETHMNCPQDCPLDKPDEWCTKESDGVCDPDCYEGIDPDCGGGEDSGDQAATSSTRPAGGNEGSSMQCLIYVAAFLVLAVAGILFYWRRKKRDILRQREEFLRWKEEQERIEKSTKRR